MMMMIGDYGWAQRDLRFAVGCEGIEDEFDVPVDAFSCDSFRMFEFKVKRCRRARAHDWTDCPYAHPGEKARRRDPRFYAYTGSACPDFRRGGCPRGDDCEYAHGVFECWLHPSRYRTQLCKDGTHCRRRVCFFAHTPEQLRRHIPEAYAVHVPSSPAYSSPSSPTESASPDLQFIRPFPFQFRSGSPIQTQISAHFTPFEEEDDLMVERVESGKALREKLYAKLVEENSLSRAV